MCGMEQKNIADKLRKPAWRPTRETVLGTAASVMFLAVASTGVWALTATGHPNYVETPARSIGVVVADPEPTEPAVAPSVAHDDSWGVTLPPPPAPSSGGSSGAPGSLVPFIASSDPNNANGGDYADPAVFCQSGSASGNPPRCD